jgi:hypothetical protein
MRAMLHLGFSALLRAELSSGSFIRKSIRPKTPEQPLAAARRGQE